MKTFASWTRRDFIAKPLSLFAASRVFGGFGLLSSQLPTLALGGAAGEQIIHRTLGKTGIKLPIVSMGVMNASIPGVVRRAYEVGIRHFDTAAMYQQGRNEEMVGSVVKEMGIRDKVAIATKVFIPPPRRRTSNMQAEFRTIFEGSLQRLQMDHVDILYYHSVDSAADAALEAPIAMLNAFKKEGKARFIGISTHSSEEVLNEASRLGAYDVVLFTINRTMAGARGLMDAVDRAAKKGIGLIAMKTQAGGTVQPDPKLPTPLSPVSQTAMLKWVLRNESITTAIPGFTNYEHLEQDFSVASNLEYTRAERDFLADKSFGERAEFCVQCGQCRSDCPSQVEIPTLMRSHMYAVQYSNPGLARDTLAQLGDAVGLRVCATCTSCKATCRRTVNIARKISDLKEISGQGFTLHS